MHILWEGNRNGVQTATIHQPQTNPKAHIKQKHEEHKQTNGRKQKHEETDKHKDRQPGEQTQETVTNGGFQPLHACNTR